MNIENIRKAGQYGLIAVVLSLLQVIPHVGIVFGIASLVLLYICHKTIQNETGSQTLLKNTVMFIVINFVAILIAQIMVVGGILSMMAAIGASHEGAQAAGAIGGGLLMLVAFVIGYGGLIVSFHFAKKVYLELYETFNVDAFKTASTLLFWGAVGVILFGLGALAILVGWIFAGVGYNQLRTLEKTE